MKALMLAAGLGRRLYGDGNDQPPKALLKFNGCTLIQRHIDILISCGVENLVIVVGHKCKDLIIEVDRVAPSGFATYLFNRRYKEGPKLSLATAAKVLRSGSDLLFMDADVLYHSDLIRKLLKSKHQNCFAMDREFQSAYASVKICLKEGHVVDFGKRVSENFDIMGEWPGFLKMSSELASLVADIVEDSIKTGKEFGDYEEIFQAALSSFPHGTFKVEDISGIPWVEIDVKSDLVKAKTIIMPQVDWIK